MIETLDLIQFVDTNPFVSVVIVVCLYFLLKLPFRMINILVRGWPPEHLDADGDVHHKNEDNEEEDNQEDKL